MVAKSLITLIHEGHQDRKCVIIAGYANRRIYIDIVNYSYFDDIQPSPEAPNGDRPTRWTRGLQLCRHGNDHSAITRDL